MGQQCVRQTCQRGGGDGTEFTLDPAETPQTYTPAAQGAAVTDGVVEVIPCPKDAQGRKNGFGKIKEAGYEYEGSFVNDFKEGQGKLIWPDGRVYEGQFVQGKFEGKAIMSWSDGRRYEGEYSQGRKHGYGVFLWPDGRKYTGEWYDGKRHGKGTYTNAKGETRTGLWDNDRPISWN